MKEKKISWYFRPVKNEEGHTSPGRIGNVLHTCEDCLHRKGTRCTKYPDSRCDASYHCVTYEYNSDDK